MVTATQMMILLSPNLQQLHKGPSGPSCGSGKYLYCCRHMLSGKCPENDDCSSTLLTSG